jgi:hypothetical protein
MTVTLVALLKRRPEMTKADFIAKYEAQHRLIGERVLGGYATRYVRRFLHPVDGVDRDYDPDVLTEIDFPDEATRQACFAALAEPNTMAMIAEDEATLFDRSRSHSFVVEEHVSAMPAVGP